MYRALLIAILLTGCISENAETKISFDYTQENLQNALKSGRPTVLQFAVSWCSYCLRMEPIMKELKKEYSGRVNIITANFDTEKDLVSEYRVFSTPFFVFFDANGEVLRTLVGYQSRDNIERVINSILTGSFTFDTSPTGELAIEKVRWADGLLILSLRLRDDRYVKRQSLKVFLDGYPLKIRESKPDVISIDAPPQVYIFNIDVLRVVAEAPNSGELIEAQLSIVDEEGGCGEGVRDIFAYYKLP